MSGALASKRVAIYARYSSSHQSEASIEDQLRRCTAHVHRLGGQVDDALVFSDAAISGASLSRPAFERVMALVQLKQIDVLITEDVSRISRDFADSASVLRRLEYEGVRLIGVADGIDTATGGAKLLFGIKSAMNESYLDDLRYKTLRGLEGRCLAGYSTGGLPYGYRSEPDEAPDGRMLGNRIVVDEDAANIVRRVFDLYLAGQSCDAIAKLFNTERVPYARLTTKHRRKGWVSSTVRAMIHNRAYVGEWSYKRREWRKLPGTNTRRPRRRALSEVIVRQYPERRIVSPEIWEQVRQRADAVSAKYKGKRGTVSAPGNRTHYPLSGLLSCGKCGAAMVIVRGTSAAYYACGDHKKRGTCANHALLREDVARTAILGGVRDALFTPAAIAFLRKRIVERLREVGRTGETDLQERLDRLRRTEDRIHGLIKFIADGDHSTYIRDTLKDLEAQARIDSDAIETLKQTLRAPVNLPTPEALLDRARDLERVLAADPLRAREALRAIFEAGRITVHPRADGSYVAEGTFLPLVAIADPSASPKRGAAARQAEVFSMLSMTVTVSMNVVVARPPDRRRKARAERPTPEGDAHE